MGERATSAEVDAEALLFPAAEPNPKAWPALFALGSVCALAAASTIFQLQGADTWWHVRTGRWIWENGSIPGHDVFSHTWAGEPLGYTDLLAQLTLYGLDSLGGAEALMYGKAFVVLLAIIALARLPWLHRDPLHARAQLSGATRLWALCGGPPLQWLCGRRAPTFAWLYAPRSSRLCASASRSP